MLSLTFVLTLFLAADITINKGYAQINIQDLLQSLQHQVQQQDNQIEQVKDKYDDTKDDDDDDDGRFGSLRDQEVQRLIQQALQNDDEDLVQGRKEPYVYKDRQQHQHRAQTYRDNDQAIDRLNIYGLLNALSNKQDNEDSSLDIDMLERLIGKQLNDQNKKKKNVKKQQEFFMDHLNQLIRESDQQQPKHHSKKRRLRPNDLLGDLYPATVNRADTSDLNEYSKIYVIFNVDAIEKSKNQNRLTDMISTMLKSTSSQKDRHEPRKEQRYKGFLLSDGSRRASRDSSEVYAPKDSDLDYKPKRARSRVDSGGGGRTPIPYIRHRGDIYEKDN